MAHVVQMKVFGFVRLRYIWPPFFTVMPHFGHTVLFLRAIVSGSDLSMVKGCIELSSYDL